MLNFAIGGRRVGDAERLRTSYKGCFSLQSYLYPLKINLLNRRGEE